MYGRQRGQRGLGKYTLGRPLREQWEATEQAQEEAKKAQQDQLAEMALIRQQRRPKCRCKAYGWPHRIRGGLCRHPDPPIATWQGKAGTHAPIRRRGFRRVLMEALGWKPIQHKRKIAELLPDIYAAWCRGDWSWLEASVPGVENLSDYPGCRGRPFPRKPQDNSPKAT